MPTVRRIIFDSRFEEFLGSAIFEVSNSWQFRTHDTYENFSSIM